MNVPSEVKLITSAFGLYASFLNWGYLQERLASTDYSVATRLIEGVSSTNSGEIIAGVGAKWTHAIFLNCCMAQSCCVTAAVFLMYYSSSSGLKANEGSSILKPDKELALASLSHTLASPFGYLSLRYINYPMLLLVKSSKLVPVMLLSYLMNGQTYSSKQILSVALISLGVALFSCKVHPKTLLFPTNYNDHDAMSDTVEKSKDMIKSSIGFMLVSINLLLDGFTNARQDKYRNGKKDLSSFYMMYQLNVWQVIYMSTYLSIAASLAKLGIIDQSSSQLHMAVQFMSKYPRVIQDVLLFSLCGAIGQIFIFYIITSFGSLLCVIITVTRKFFSILLSVLIFGHVVMWWQWCGVIMVFQGLILNSLDKYLASSKKQTPVTTSLFKSEENFTITTTYLKKVCFKIPSYHPYANNVFRRYIGYYYFILIALIYLILMYTIMRLT